jgi:hypothetical protein
VCINTDQATWLPMPAHSWKKPESIFYRIIFGMVFFVQNSGINLVERSRFAAEKQ